MNNNSKLLMLIGLITLIAVKVILGLIGIKNIPVPVGIGLSMVGCLCVVISLYIRRDKLGNAKKYLIIMTVILIAMSITAGAIAILIKYFPETVYENKYILLILLVVAMLLFISLVPVSIQIKKNANK